MTSRDSVVDNLGATPVILAGGLGTRLRQVVNDRPKVLATVNGRPFIFYLLDRLVEFGADKVVLCVGYMADLVESTLGHEYRGVRLEYSREYALLGTGGALRHALPLIESPLMLVLNGDSFFDCNLSEFYRWHIDNAPTGASIMLTEVEDTRRFGRVNLDAQSHVLSFDEKGAVDGTGWINAGIYLLTKELLTQIPAGRVTSIEKDFFPTLIGRGFYGYRGGNGRFIDIGTPESYNQAERMFHQDKLENIL